MNVAGVSSSPSKAALSLWTTPAQKWLAKVTVSSCTGGEGSNACDHVIAMKHKYFSAAKKYQENHINYFQVLHNAFVYKK